MLMERSRAYIVFQASHPSTRFPFQRSKDSRERDGGRVEMHVGGGSHSRQQVEIVGRQIDVEMVRQKKAVQDYHDSQNQTGAAYEEPPLYYAEMNECFTTSQKNTVKGCQYGLQSTTSGPPKKFGFGYDAESTSPDESAKKSDGSTVRKSI